MFLCVQVNHECQKQILLFLHSPSMQFIILYQTAFSCVDSRRFATLVVRDMYYSVSGPREFLFFGQQSGRTCSSAAAKRLCHQCTAGVSLTLCGEDKYMCTVFTLMFDQVVYSRLVSNRQIKLYLSLLIYSFNLFIPSSHSLHQQVKGNLTRLLSCIEELRSLPQEGCVRQRGALLKQAVLDSLQQFKQYMCHTAHGDFNSNCVEVRTFTAKTKSTFNSLSVKSFFGIVRVKLIFSVQLS